MNTKQLTKVLNIAIALLMLAILICQFTPFWSANGDQSSLIGMTGRQYNHEAMIEYLDAKTGGFSYLDISQNVLITIAVSAFGFALALKNHNAPFNGVFGAVVAFMGIELWLKVPAYTLGKMGNVIFVLDLVLAALSAALIVLFLLKIIFAITKKLK